MRSILHPILCALLLTGLAHSANAETRQVTVDASEFKYSPQIIKVNSGQRLEILMKNHGVLSHNITFPDREAATETVQNGNKTSVTVTFDKPGEYTFYCSVPGHKNAGMTGTVIVE